MTDRTIRPSRAIFAALLMLAAAILTGLASPASAQNFENLERLDSLVAMSVGANRGEPGGPLAPIDSRLRLAACPVTPRIEGPQMNAAIVSCPAIGWRIRVPLAPGLQAQKTQISANNAPSMAATQSVVVKKGDPVQLVAGDSEFSVSRPMIADEDGAVGAIIRVKQDTRAAPVLARVEAMGIVRAPGI
jgi:flagella basal body P-ring formation protein FlgA